MNRFPVPFRFVALILLALAVVSVGILNVRARMRLSEAADGVFWVESAEGLLAAEVSRGGAGETAGIVAGDRLSSINGLGVAHLGDYANALYGAEPNRTVVYSLRTKEGQREAPVLLESRSLFSPADALRAVLAFLHLGIGLWVVFGAIRAPRALHFFWICLAAFVVYLFSYTTRWDALDQTVYVLSLAFFLLLPALFVHFCLRFPLESKGGHALLLYLPAIVLGFLQLAWLTGRMAKLGLPLVAHSSQLLDRVHLLYFCAGFGVGGLALARRSRKVSEWVPRQQMRWVSYGTLAGIVPFGLLYGVPFMLGSRPSFGLAVSMLSLALVPLSFAYAVVRFRLSDVEVIVRRGAAYFLSSSVLLGLYLLLVLGLGRAIERLVPDAGFLVISGAALAIALLFAPLRSRIQERLDRVFFKERFHDRSTLLDFARALTTEVSLPLLSSSVLERISRTFRIPQAAVYLSDPVHRGFCRQVGSVGLTSAAVDDELVREEDLEQKNAEPGHRGMRGASPDLANRGLFFLQELRVRDRRVGLLALGRPRGGNEFSSEDRELLSAIAGYAAIAFENASLYRSVENKAKELERLKLYTENILESINVAVLALDTEGRVTSCNRAFEELYGVGRNGVRGADIGTVLPGDVLDSLRRITGAARWEVKEPAHMFKLYLENRRGQRLFVNLSLIPFVEAFDFGSGCLVVIDDITSKVQLESQIQQVEKLSSLGLLAAGIAHEVNTPIAGISSYTQMLIRQTPDSDQRRQLLEKIEKQTFRAAEIVNGLLNFARLNGSEFTDLDLNQLIRDSLSLIDHQMKQSRIRVATDLAGSLPPVHGNAGKLQQVFINLFMNARDAMPSGGDLEVRTAMNDTMVLVDIRDTGVGISRENIKRIYDPFFTTKSTGKGTGLGLAVTYGILQDHGARIFVDSTPGQGTVFRIKLPTRALSQ